MRQARRLVHNRAVTGGTFRGIGGDRAQRQGWHRVGTSTAYASATPQYIGLTHADRARRVRLGVGFCRLQCGRTTKAGRFDTRP